MAGHCIDLDRVTPTRPPAGRRRTGVQSWRDLLFVHYRLDPKSVRALVPPELELDLWDGDAWVGIVPFAMRGVRPWWMPIGLDFLETNLRTYVHVDGQPGVYFFSLEAASWPAVQAARIGWGLPYHHAEMSSVRDGEVTRYATERHGSRAGLRVSYRVGAPLGPSEPGSLEFFLLERYYLFSKHRGEIHKGHVHHVPYPAHAATVSDIDERLISAAGMPATSGPPATVHFSPGVDVDVYGPWPLAAESGR